VLGGCLAGRIVARHLEIAAFDAYLTETIASAEPLPRAAVGLP
jgi:hypothetical protein